MASTQNPFQVESTLTNAKLPYTCANKQLTLYLGCSGSNMPVVDPTLLCPEATIIKCKCKYE
jgi:hypothetical protein